MVSYDHGDQLDREAATAEEGGDGTHRQGVEDVLRVMKMKKRSALCATDDNGHDGLEGHVAVAR